MFSRRRSARVVVVGWWAALVAGAASHRPQEKQGENEKVDASIWPQTADPVSAARLAAAGGNATMVEFVHVHKCAGTTVNAISALFCQDGDLDLWQPQNAPRSPLDATLCARVHTPLFLAEDEHEGVVGALIMLPPVKKRVCRLVRPHPSMLSTAVREGGVFSGPFRPRFVSAFEEWSGFVLPWDKHHFKATIVRDPFSWWISAMRFECRCKNDRPNLAALEHMRGAHKNGHGFSNRIANTVLPRELAASLQLATASDHTAAARGVIQSYAFVGIVEDLDRSLCLFAQTFLSMSSNYKGVCALCCLDHKKHIPRQNAAPDTDFCAFNATDEDRTLFEAHHAADIFVYDTVAEVLKARLDASRHEHWAGNLDKQTCNCDTWVNI